MLHDALITAAADLWTGSSIDTTSEYLRGQAELICNVNNLSIGENRGSVIAEIVAKAEKLTAGARMGNYQPLQS